MRIFTLLYGKDEEDEEDDTPLGEASFRTLEAAQKYMARWIDETVGWEQEHEGVWSGLTESGAWYHIVETGLREEEE